MPYLSVLNNDCLYGLSSKTRSRELFQGALDAPLRPSTIRSGSMPLLSITNLSFSQQRRSPGAISPLHTAKVPCLDFSIQFLGVCSAMPTSLLTSWTGLDSERRTFLNPLLESHTVLHVTSILDEIYLDLEGVFLDTYKLKISHSFKHGNGKNTVTFNT